MKKFVFKCMAVALALTTLCTGAFAATSYTVSTDFVNDEIIVTGTGVEAERVIFQVLKKDKSFEDWTESSDIDDFLLCHTQATIDETGEYTLEVPYATDLAAGEYEFRLVSDVTGVLTSEQSPLALVGTDTYKAALAGILEEANAATPDYDLVKDYIGGDGKVSPAAFDLALFSKLDLGDPEEVLASYLDYVAGDGSADYAEENLLVEANMASRSANFNTFMVLEALDKGGVIDDLESALEGSTFADDEPELWADIQACVVYDNEWAYMTDKLEGNGSIDNVAELKQALIEALVLCETRYADGDDIKKVLVTLDYAGDIGITRPTSLKAVYGAMAGKDYEDIDAFVEAYKEYVEKYSTDGGGGGDDISAPSHWTGKYVENDAQVGNSGSIQIPYVDIEGILWAHDAIVALTDMGIVQGKGDGYFYPESSVTREEFVKIIVGALGYADAGYAQNHFGDVSENDWFCSYVNIAYEKGLVNGIGGGLFGTGQALTRQDMVVMLYNALVANNAELTAGEASFTDANKIADYAKTAVGTLYTMGVVNGVSDTEFDPLGIANRAQASKVVYGVLKLLK